MAGIAVRREIMNKSGRNVGIVLCVSALLLVIGFHVAAQNKDSGKNDAASAPAFFPAAESRSMDCSNMPT